MATSPRVVFFNRVYWPAEAATAQLLTDLAEGLAARGIRVVVVTSGREELTRHGVAIHRLGEGSPQSGLIGRLRTHRDFNARVDRWIRTQAQAGDLLVAMTDPPLLAATVASAAAAVGARTLNWIQDIYPEIIAAHTGSWISPLLWLLRRRRDTAWRTAAANICVSPDMHPILRAAAVPPETIRTIRNPAPRELEPPPSPDGVAQWRQDQGLTGQFIVAYSGNLGRVHELETVVAAASLLRAVPRISLVFIGDGPRAAQLRNAVAALKLSNVRFLPLQPRNRLAVAMGAADVHLVTMRPGFQRLVNPSKLAGILAAARPALFVGPDDCDPARLIREGDCGRVITPGDAARLAADIQELANQPALTHSLRPHARAAYERHFSFSIALEEWSAVLAALTRSR